jgi:hypothetical protein
MELFLQKSVIEDKKLTVEGLAVYVALRKIVNKTESNYYVSANMLYYILTAETKYQQRFYDSIKSGIANLIDIKLITKINDAFINDYILDLSKIYFETKKPKDAELSENNYFVKINLDEVHKIMKVKNIKFQLLKYFIFLIGSIDNSSFTYINSIETVNSFVGGLTIDYHIKLTGIPKSNILAYSNVLEDLKLVYFYRHQDYVAKDGKTISLHNSYGRYKDKDLITKYGKEYAEAKGSSKCNKKVTKNIANIKNSLIQKYNSLANGYGKYTPNDIKEIYEFILIYNADQDKVSEFYKNNTSDYAISQIEKANNKKKDISIFNKYDYIDAAEDNSKKLKLAVVNSIESNVIVKKVKSQNPFKSEEVGNNFVAPKTQENEAMEHFINQQIAETEDYNNDEIDISSIYDYSDYDPSYEDDLY